MNHRLRKQGFSLIEAIIFIVIMGIIATTLLIPLSTLLRNSSANDQLTQAVMLAHARMSVYLGLRKNYGFTTYFPNGNPVCMLAVCGTAPAGYSILTTVSTGYNGSTNYKQITVTVTGLSAGTGNATVQTLIANYP